MADVSNAMDMVTSTPEEAGKILKDSVVAQVPPDVYAENIEEYQPVVDATRRPTEATETVAKVIHKSPQHAAIFQDKEDVDNMSWLERYGDHFKNQVWDLPNATRRSNELALKRMTDPAGFSEDDLVEWHLLQDEVADINKDETRNGFTGDFETLPAKVVGVAGDLVRGIYDQKATVAGFTAAGAAGGAGWGAGMAAIAGQLGPQAALPEELVTVPAAAIAGGAVGARTGFQAGLAVATFMDTYNQSAGSLYTELTFGTDENGQPFNIDEEDKRNLARGLGVISGSVDGILTLTVAKAIPQVSKFLKPSLRNIMARGGSQTAYKTAVLNIGKLLSPAQAQAAKNIGGAALVGSSTETVQEMAQIIGEELGKSMEVSEDGQQTQFSIENAIMRMSDNIDKWEKLSPEEKAKTPHPYFSRLKSAALVGGVAGGGFVAPFNVLGIRELERQVEERNRMFDQQQQTGVPVALQPSPEAPAVTSTDGGGMAIIQDGQAPAVPAALARPPEQADLVQPSGKPTPTPEQRAVKASRVKELLQTASAVVKSTKAYQAAAEQAQMMRNEILQKAGVVELWIDSDAANAFANNPEKAKRVRELLDPSGESAAAMNAPIRVPPAEALRLIDDFPDAAGMMKMEPEDPSADSAIRFIQARNEADAKRQELLKKGGEQGADLTTVNTLDQALRDDEYKTTQVFDEATYWDQPMFTETIASVMGEKEIARLTESQRRVRMEIIDAIDEASKLEMDKVADAVFDAAVESEFEIQAQRLENDPNIKIVEMFTNGDVGKFTGTRRAWDPVERAADLTAAHHKPGFSPMAIDPRLVPDELKPYTKDKRLVRNKTFVKGGIHPDEAARMAGVESGERLLKILSTTMNREDAVKAAVEIRKQGLREQAAGSVSPNEAAITRAYTNNTANHLQEMKIMRDREWPSAKAGIKRIALHLPRIQELTQRARRAVGTMRIKDLKVNQFVMGERRSQRKAVDAILKNEVEKAFIAKESAALNSEFIKETRVAIGRVNRIIKFARKFNKPDVIRELKDAGALYDNAAQEILSVFKLNRKAVDLEDRSNLNKFVERMIERGEGDLSVPEQYWDFTKDISEMSVEQVEIIGNRLEQILHLARVKNRLYKKFKKAAFIETIEGTATALNKVALENPEYDVKKTVAAEGDLGFVQRVGQVLSTAESALSSFEHQLNRLDNYKVGGLYNQVFYQRMAGVGEFKGTGLDGLANDMAEFKKFFDEGIYQYGKGEFADMGRTPIQVTEFVGNPLLNNGDLTKSDLFAMALNIGNAGNLEAIENFGITQKKALDVIEKYLTKKDLDFIQDRVWNVFKQYEGRVKELHKRTANLEVDMVEAQPFTMFGKEYSGGYYPLYYGKGVDATLKELLAGTDFDVSTEPALRKNFYTTGMTRQGHLIQRRGSAAPLSLDLHNMSRGFNQVLTDLNLREPVRDTMNLLRNETIAKDMVSVIGKENYSMIVNTVIDAANSASQNDTPLFGIQSKAFQKLVGGVAGVMSNTMLVANVSTILIQPTSSFIAWEKMGGKSGAKHLARTLSIAARDPRTLKTMLDFAAEMNPAIKDQMAGVADAGAMAISKSLPKKSGWMKAKNARRLKYIDMVHTMMNELGYGALASVDLAQKAMVTNAAYSQFMAGEAPGWSKAEIAAMDAQTRHERAAGYASSMSRLTLTSGTVLDRAAFQKDPSTNMWVRFWNDLRNVLNNTIARGRQTKHAIKNKRYLEASNILLTTFAISAMSKMYIGWVRDDEEENPIKDVDLKTSEGVMTAAENMGKMFMKSPIYAVERIPESTPILRDIWYAQKRRTKGDEKPVGIPVISMATDVATAISASPIVFDNMLEALNIIDSSDDLSETQMRALLRTGSYVTGGWPVNAYYKGRKMFEEWGDDTGTDLAIREPEVEKFTAVVDRLQKRDDLPQDFKDEIADVSQQIAPVAESPQAAIDPTVYPIIAQIESGGEWSAKNPESSAAGLYQFLEGTWADIMERAPELGLTENGRVSSNTEQQELAMRWYTEQSAKALAAKDYPVDVTTLYTMHFLGQEAGIKFMGAKDNRYLKTIVGKEVMTANKFSDTMTVGEFKKWVDAKVTAGEDALLKAEGN